MKKPQIFAFYLPQFYPFPENDEWWGKGFTEWTNVAKAKSLYPGHYQPHVPADLGFYDLRLSQPRHEQGEMAKKYGIDAFCYYHYWFGEGKQLMETPLKEVIRLKDPDFPFFICWANHSWYNKNWNSQAQKGEDLLLIEQKYPGVKDVEEQFYTLLPAFKDCRYYKVDGKLAYMIYKADDLPYYEEYCKTFNRLARENGLPGFFFMSNVQTVQLLQHPANKYMDANFLCLQKEAFGSYTSLRIKSHLSTFFKFPFQIASYKTAAKRMLSELHKEENIHPVILPNWDHSPRLGYNGTIYHNSTPRLWKKLLYDTIQLIKHKKESNQMIMIKSWNEWAEGNHLEPDLKYGLAYLKVIKEIVEELQKK